MRADWRLVAASSLALGLLLGAAKADAEPFALPPSPDSLPPFLLGVVEGSILGGVYTSPLCPSGSQCVLNTGGGLGARMEWRFPKYVSTGLGAELLLIDGAALYEIGTMQTLRYTLRILGLRKCRIHPLLDFAAGVALFGDSFTVDTYGGFTDLRGGIEVELSPPLAVDFSFGARTMMFARYRTALDGIERASSHAPIIALSFHVGFVIMPRTTKPRAMHQRRGAPNHFQPDARE